MQKESGQNPISGIIAAKSSGYDKTTMLIALVLALLIHVSILLLLPAKFQTNIIKDESSQELEIDIIPPEVEKLMPEYIEANPDANNQVPDKKTNLESFQDQKAAQENPVKNSTSDTPRTDGKEQNSQKIVSGNAAEIKQSSQSAFETLSRPLENANPRQSTQEQAQNVKAPPKPREKKIENPKDNAKAEAKKSESQAKEFIAPNVIAREGDEPLKTSKNNKDEFENPQVPENPQQKVDNILEEVSAQNLPKPQARRRISMKTPAGPIRASNTDANAVGALAVNSRFSEFGAYQQRMIEAVSRQWYLLGSRYDLASSRKTNVIIEFKLNPKGEITSFKTIFNSSTQTGKSLCEQAILSTAPYGEWSEEMIVTFGSQDQTVTFSFFY